MKYNTFLFWVVFYNLDEADSQRKHTKNVKKECVGLVVHLPKRQMLTSRAASY